MPASQTCRNCLHWARCGNQVKVLYTRHDKFTYERSEYRDQVMDHGEVIEDLGQVPFGRCSHPKFVYTQSGGMIEDDMKTPADGLGYSDGEAYAAYFYTGEDFGCVHFSPNPEAL